MSLCSSGLSLEGWRSCRHIPILCFWSTSFYFFCSFRFRSTTLSSDPLGIWIAIPLSLCHVWYSDCYRPKIWSFRLHLSNHRRSFVPCSIFWLLPGQNMIFLAYSFGDAYWVCSQLGWIFKSNRYPQRIVHDVVDLLIHCGICKKTKCIYFLAECLGSTW